MSYSKFILIVEWKSIDYKIEAFNLWIKVKVYKQLYMKKNAISGQTRSTDYEYDKEFSYQEITWQKKYKWVAITWIF